MNNITIHSLADTVYRLSVLSKAATDYETRSPAAYPIVGFDVAESIVFLMEQVLDGIREAAHAEDLDIPDAELSAACAITKAAALEAFETESGRVTLEDFYSLLYPLADTIEKLYKAFDAIAD